MDERGLGASVSLAIVAILLGEAAFEILVSRGERCIGAEQVAKLQSLNPRLIADDHEVKVMSPSASRMPHEPTPVWQCSVKLRGGFVAVCAQRIQQGIGLAERPESGEEIDNRLRR